MDMGRKNTINQLAFAATLGLLLAAPVAQATNTPSLQISEIIANTSSFDGGTAWIYSTTYATTAWPNPAGCTKTDRAMIDPSEANYNLLMTMVYDAYANGDQIIFNITSLGCVTIGSQTYPKINEVILIKS
jgi:hypothetical protein